MGDKSLELRFRQIKNGDTTNFWINEMGYYVSRTDLRTE